MILSKGEVYVRTFLEHAKGSALDIIVDYEVPIGMVALLSSFTEQIRSFHFLCSRWEEIQSVSEIISGSLPLLHTLTIDITEEDGLDDFKITPPSLPPFSNAVNLEALHFHSTSDRSPFVLHLVLPNLVSFDLLIGHWGGFPAFLLFDFLEGSPML